MRKRFTDIDKWEDAWFCKLTSASKLFWIYLCDRCDHSGVWEVNWDLAQYHLGPLDIVATKAVVASRITEVSGGRKWFVRGFITFQYPTGLSTTSPAHKRIRMTLTRHGVDPDSLRVSRVVPRVLDTPEEEDEEEDSISLYQDIFAKADPAAIIPRQLCLGDLEATNPVLLVFHGNRPMAQTMLDLYGWDPCVAGIKKIEPTAKAREPNRRRVMVEELNQWLSVNYELGPEDYRRAGIAPPKEPDGNQTHSG